ncbi:MAG: DNA-directed RNA polymerase subunit delta [Bacilli bacterium]|nr:DNA-directed RNA polymerase subunit delta [Bacilli bacterium]
MAINKLTNEQLTTMSYTDVAEYVLEQKNKKMKIADLFMEVIKLRGDEEYIFESKIGDFFGLISTDKRFVMLDKGFFDLSKKYKNKVDLNIEEDEEEEIEIEEEETEEEDVINYDEAIDVDDDQEEDDYKDLVVIDSDEDVNMDL